MSVPYNYNLWSTTKPHTLCTFQILGVSGSEDRGEGANSIQFINFGRVGDKSFKEWWKKNRGVEGWMTTMFWLFCPAVLNEECHFLVYFYMRLPVY